MDALIGTAFLGSLLCLVVLLYLVVLAVRIAQKRAKRLQKEQFLAASYIGKEPPGCIDAETTNRIIKHVADFDNIGTYQEVNCWDATTTKLAASLEDHAESIQKWVTETNNLLCGAQLGHSYTKSKERLHEYENYLSRLELLNNDLLERVDFSPNSKAEQLSTLQSLKQEKQTLVLDRKQCLQDVKNIRSQARVDAVRVIASPWSGSFRKSMAAEKRIEIRRIKEQEIGPHEDAIQALDRRLLAIDRRVLWVKRLKD